MKIFFRRIHLYLSLAAGLVILIACLTGAILVFEKDLQMATSKERYYVKPEGQKLPLAQLVKAVRDSFPKSSINGVKLYNDPTRSVEMNVMFSSGREAKPKEEPKKEEARKPQRQPGFTVFVNPYTGAILEKYSYRETWFYQVFALHRWLLGGEGSPGKYIVGVSTAIFLFILLTGIILWWPKTRAIMKQRLRIKWGASWKRINHDLHLVLGFYSAIFLFIIAFTGLAWSFEWFNNSIYAVTNSPLKPTAPPKSVYQPGVKQLNYDQAFAIATSTTPQPVSYNISIPKDSTEAVQVSVLPQQAVHENATDAIYLDQYSGAVIGTLPYANRSLGARVRSTFKPIHTGSIWGLPSKIVAFLVCLFGVSFPITGTIMWVNRTRKRTMSGKRKEAIPTVI